jgi:pyruvate kinase
VLLDDGRIVLNVTEVDDDSVTAEAMTGGQLGSRKDFNVPCINLGLDLITEVRGERVRRN